MNNPFYLDLGKVGKIHEIFYDSTTNRDRNKPLKAKGTIAKVGWMTYFDDKGIPFYQYVPPQTLFARDHLETVGLLPVTLDHPPETVNTDNYKDYCVGSIGDRIWAELDGGNLQVIFNVSDREAIEEILDGNKRELSMGYWAELEPTEQEDEFIQVKRTANHVAIVDKARGGPTLKLNIDCLTLQESDRLQQIDTKNNQKPQDRWKVHSIRF